MEKPGRRTCSTDIYYIYIYHAKQIGGDEKGGKIHKTAIF